MTIKKGYKKEPADHSNMTGLSFYDINVHVVWIFNTM